MHMHMHMHRRRWNYFTIHFRTRVCRIQGVRNAEDNRRKLKTTIADEFLEF